MDLAERTHNPWGWWYQVDKESDGHFAIWFINKSTDKVFMVILVVEKMERS
jgi:hypothetical protein